MDPDGSPVPSPGAPAHLFTADAIRRGRRLYLAGRFFEAHQEWEEAWRVERGPMRELLQGLILVTAAMFKARTHKNPRGAVKLLDAALGRLGALPEHMAGLSPRRICADAARAREAARRWRDGEAALPLRPPLL
jgi:predicted metal-dependent hydrolase